MWCEWGMWWVHVWLMYAGMHAYVKAREEHWMSPSSTFHLMSEMGVSTEPRACFLGWVGWLMSSWDLSISAYQCWGNRPR